VKSAKPEPFSRSSLWVPNLRPTTFPEGIG
jgi:hypothetical protein